MARILLDLRMVHGPLHGIARYALELARRLPALEPGWQFTGLVGPQGLPDDLNELMPRFPLVKCQAAFLSPFEQPALAASLFKVRPDLFHATSFSLPSLWPGNLVATIHDATHLALGSSASKIAYYRLVVTPRARRARALITVSEFSRSEISKYLKIIPEKLQVIANGVDAEFRPPMASDISEFRERRGLPARYFAAIGNIKEHKNLQLFRGISNSLGAPLVLLAGRGARRALNLDERVIELAPLPDDDLVKFYAGSTAVLFPSKYEGFGLPALEAMACGAPVIAANAGALPEVVGSAGLLVSPDDPRAWTEAALKMLRDEKFRQTCSTAGQERALRFSWDDCARQTLTVYRRALGQQGESLDGY